MKALAAEMVRNFGSRLEPLGISVRELTGDMSLTKSEIMKTQVHILFLILHDFVNIFYCI
jgi:activating signal cointegrator complex subunit 3